MPIQQDLRDPPPALDLALDELDRVLASPDFDASRRSREFLRFVVEEALAGRGSDLSQHEIAIRVFERRADFDPTVDPIVRIQAGRLRRSLERYYLLSGARDPLRIELPRGAYVPRFRAVEGAAARGREDAPPPVLGLAVEPWPTVVVSHFENKTGEAAGDSIVERVRDELATELGRYADVHVVSYNRRASDSDTLPAAWSFALSGAVRAVGGDIEVAARLVDSASGQQLWADAFPTSAARGGAHPSPEDVARVIAARLGAEEGVVVQNLAERCRKTGFPSNAYGALLRSYDFYLVRDPAHFSAVLDALRRVATQSPESGLAWTRLARLCMANHAFELTALDTPIETAIRYAQTGVRLDPGSRRARCILGSALLVSGDLVAARREAEAALRSTPGSLVYLEIVGWLLTLAGDWDRGPAIVREAMARNPYHLPHVSHALWLHHTRRGDHGAAYAETLAYRDSAFFWRASMRASSLGHLGRRSEAQREVEELLRQRPDFSARGRTLIGRYVKFEELRECIVEGLRRAGLRLD